ncbi:MAG: thiol reductant ABC exporter subunit CydC, partial [Gordonibacter sp.]
FGKPILHYLERLQSHDWVLRMTSGLRAALYRSLEKDALFFRATHRTGDILGLLAEDIGHIQNLYLRTVFPTAIAWLLYVVLVAAAGFFSAFLALALVLGLGVVVFVVPLVSVLVNGARRLRYKQLRAELYAELTDNVLGVSDWVFAQRGDEYLQRYRDSERAMKRIALSQDRFDRRRDVVVQAVFALVAVLLLVWAGATFGGGDTGTANWIAAVVLGFFPLIEAFSPLSSAAVDAFAYTDSVARLNALPYLAEDEPAAEPCVPKDPLVLCVDRVHYRYPGTDRDVLEGLSLKVAPGEKVAILGRSGAGKSTLATLLRGDIEPNQGSVTLGGAPTCPLHDGAPRYFGVIQQRTYLFNMTLLENLRLAREQASEEQVWEVLEKVGLREMARRLPAGLHTMVDEAGMRFSGGERHRIALARVLLQEVPVVILDEPTVGLDPLTERALLETVFEALEGKTVIMITHHLAGVSLMDRVVFVEDGRVEMDGSPAELARTSERYRSLMAFDRGIELEG